MPYKSNDDKNAHQRAYYKRRCEEDPTYRLRTSQRLHRAENLRVEKTRQWANEYKVSRGCKRCGFREHPAALDFHHRDPLQKEFSIGASIKRFGLSLTRVKKEAEKCDVLCANCHRILEYMKLVGDQGVNPCRTR
jgi:hypothetical protein